MTTVANVPVESVREREGLRSSGLGPYVVVGLALCLFLEAVFWLRLGGAGLLAWPFLWGYSQVAMLQGLLKDLPRSIYGLLWSVSYLAIAIVLWTVLERPRHAQEGIWRRALLGWVGVQVLISILAWVLASRGIVVIE